MIALRGLLAMMGSVVGVFYFALWALFYKRSLANLNKLSPLFYGATALLCAVCGNSDPRGERGIYVDEEGARGAGKATL